MNRLLEFDFSWWMKLWVFIKFVVKFIVDFIHSSIAEVKFRPESDFTDSTIYTGKFSKKRQQITTKDDLYKNAQT